MPVGDLAVDAQTAGKDATIKDLAQRMGTDGIGDLIIVENETPVGIVTDRDIALAVGQYDDVSSMTASDLMAEGLATIQADAEAIELPKKMAEHKVRRIPVVDADGELQGIATLDDVVATVGEELDAIATVIEGQSPEYSPTE